jgi:hypothetical protein
LERVDIVYSIVRKVFCLELPFNRGSLCVVGGYDTKFLAGLGVAANKVTNGLNLLGILENVFFNTAHSISGWDYLPAEAAGFFGAFDDIYECDTVHAVNVVLRTEPPLVYAFGNKLPNRDRHSIWQA